MNSVQDLSSAQIAILVDLYPDNLRDATKYSEDADGIRIYDNEEGLLAIISSVYWKHIMPQ